MSVFIDTAAYLAILNADDDFHESARITWTEILSSQDDLFSSNYVVLETSALLQRRLGIEALRVFNTDILPTTQIIWIDEEIHRTGMSALLAANRRQLSLVDCTSFETIRWMGIEQVFTFNSHYSELGFRVVPG